jgi:hypothetical protein
MLPCIVIDLFLNSQPNALIIQIYSVIKLHVSGIFFAQHQEFSTVQSALVSFMQILMTASKQSQDVLCPSSGVLYCTIGTRKFHADFDDRFQTESGWNILTLLGSGHQIPHETYQCRLYSRKLLMMGREVARNM